MLKKDLRLNRKELDLFFSYRGGPRQAGKNRNLFRQGRFVILRCRKTDKTPSKFAFVVSGPKKSAVARNLARRRISEIVKIIIEALPKGFDMVFFLKLGQDKKVPKFSELKTDIINVVSSLNI